MIKFHNSKDRSYQSIIDYSNPALLTRAMSTPLALKVIKNKAMAPFHELYDEMKLKNYN